MGYVIERNIVVPGHPDFDNGLSVPPFRQVHLHSTANVNATMDGEVSYLSRNWSKGYYTHLVGGGGRIIQVAETNGGAWDVGGDWNRETYAAIEFSENIKNKDDFNKSYRAYIWLARKLADECGANYVLDDNDIVGIKTHNFASRTGHGSDHTDPIAFLAKWGISYDQLKKDLVNGLKENKVAQPKFKDGDSIRLTTKASASAYGTKFDAGTKGTWGKIDGKAFEYHKSNSSYAYRIAFWYNNAIVFWNILEQDLQKK